jgi:hypothetical protein
MTYTCPPIESFLVNAIKGLFVREIVLGCGFTHEQDDGVVNNQANADRPVS